MLREGEAPAEPDFSSQPRLGRSLALPTSSGTRLRWEGGWTRPQWNDPSVPGKIGELVAAAYPVLLDISRWTAVIIGGGPVAARKARGLLEAGAACVRCVAPAFCDAIPSEVERVRQTYCPEHLEGARLVFAATDDPEVNDAIVRDAAARQLLVNRADADDDQPGDFTVPARLRHGEVILAISAGSPSLAALIRDKLESSFDPRWEWMARAMKELRPLIKSTNLEIASRQRIFRELASEAALSVIADRGADGLRSWLLERHPELHHG